MNVAVGVGTALAVAGVVGTVFKVVSKRRAKQRLLARDEDDARIRMDAEGGAMKPV